TGISKEDCRRLHAFTAKVSRSGDGKYLYECPLGLSYITAAVSLGQGKLLRLTAGPFLMEDKQDFEEFDLPKLKDLSASDIRGVMSRIDPVPVADPKKVNAFSQLLVYSAAFLSGIDRSSEAYLAELEETEAWERANRIDPAQTVTLVNEYIRSNFARDISLLDIAKHAGMTTSYLCRLYKRECGTTVNAYLTQVRIDRSKELLAEGVPIAETAKRCGFSDQSYFTKVFRQTEGITPLKYKKTI
ncbi:MAG: AraC family transcriptional regulator, partial [Firmicutes bacterium]|nr:AraC family transcriptional regulator [Bacillota bacterium]